MAGKSIEAGRAFVRTDADLSPLEKKLKTIQTKFQALGSRISGVGSRFAAVGAGATAIGSAALGGIVALSTRFAGLGDELSKTRDRTGIAASSLSELGYAASQSGTDLATVERGVAKMQRGITEANAGSKSMAASFQAIGLSVKALAKLSPEDQFLAVGKSIADIPDPTMRAARAMQVFGKGGTQLLPLLISDIQQLRQEARDLGLVISDEDATNATNLGDAFDRVKKSLGGIATQLGAAIAVPFTKIANTIAGIIGKISAWVAANRSVVQTVAAIAAGFVVAGAVATGVGIAIIGLGATIASIGTIVGTAFAAVSATFAAIGTAVGALLSPIGLLAAAIVGIGGYAVYASLQATGSLKLLSDMFGSLGSTATTAWGGIVAAIGSGDLQTAGQIAFTALEVGWLTITTKMQEVWKRVSDFFVNVWLDVVESIVQVGASIYFGIAKTFDKLAVTLQGAFDTAFVYITGAIDGIQNQIAKAIIKAQEFFGLFSKDESLQIQSTLDSDLARRASGRQSGLDQRASGRQSGLDARDQTRRATAEQFSQIVGEDFNRRRPSGQVDSSGLSEAQKRLSELQVKLQTQSSGAVAKAAEAQQLSQKAQQADQAQRGAAAALSSTSAGSVGTFVSGVAGRIAGGGVQDAIKDATLQTATNTAKLTDQMRQMLEEGALT